MMTGTLLFALAGACFATLNLMKLIEYVDSPQLPGGLDRTGCGA